MVAQASLLADPNLRLAVIDLEASALGYGSYPLEVGVAFIRPVPQQIEVWSTLVKPLPEWLDDGKWSDRSAAIHGISIEDAQRYGLPPTEVCELLNGYLANQQIVVSDAPMHDADWLHTLFLGGDREQLFSLRHVQALTKDFSPDQHRQCQYLLGKDQAPHRAGPDAGRLAARVMEAHLGYPPTIRMPQKNMPL